MGIKALLRRTSWNEILSKPSASGYPAMKFLNLNFLGSPTNVYDQLMALGNVDTYIKHFCTNKDGKAINKYVDKRDLERFNPFSYALPSFHIAMSFNEKIS